jgi:hypothetical protein
LEIDVGDIRPVSVAFTADELVVTLADGRKGDGSALGNGRYGKGARGLGNLRDWITRMNLFKTFTLKWWQGALFKWGVLAAGMAIGTYWHGFLVDYLLLLIIFAFVSLAYITYVWSKQ